MWQTMFRWLMAMVLVVILAGCNNEEDTIDSQRQTIVRYLTSSHDPRLIAKADIENSLEYQPHFYEQLDYNVYRYIATYYDQGRDQRPEVKPGDRVQLTYMGYRFSGSAPTVRDVYSTNDKGVLSQLEEAGLNVKYWSTEPLTINFGASSIIKGVELSLSGCRLGDVVEVYMTYDAAYDKNMVGVIPKESSVAWIYTIDKIN